MANAFFNDTLAPFDGIDIGWGQDPNFPIGEYTVVEDSAAGITYQFALSQTEDGDIALSEGVLMITSPAVAGNKGDGISEEAEGMGSWFHTGTSFGGPDSEGDPFLATSLAGNKLTISNGETYGFWLQLSSGTEGELNGKGSADAGAGRLVIEEISYAVYFMGSSEYKYAGDAPDFVKKEKKPVIYLGSAKIDSEGVATFTQNTFGPIAVPAISYLDGLISKEDGSLLAVSHQDGGLRTRSIIGADRENGATQGNVLFEDEDGFLFLDITSNSDAEVGGGIRVIKGDEDADEDPDTDNTYDGKLTISNTGVVSISNSDAGSGGPNLDVKFKSTEEGEGGEGDNVTNEGDGPFAGAVLVIPPEPDRHADAPFAEDDHTH